MTATRRGLITAFVLAGIARAASAQPGAAPSGPPPPPPPPLAPPGATPPMVPGTGAPPAVSPPSERTVAFLMRFGLEFGGDDLVMVTDTDGGSTTITGGGRGLFSAGAIYHPAAPFTVEATLGWKTSAARRANGSIAFDRFPLDLIVSVAGHGHRLGAGPTVHFGPTLSCNVSGLCDQNVSFDTAVGGVIQYAYTYIFRGTTNRAVEFGARYTFLTYSGDGVPDVDGSAFGLFLGGWL